MMGSTRADQTAARALSTAENRRGTSYSLTDRTQLGLLISRSPQVDANGGTSTDQDRCGGAAVFNALLLSGNPAANARALREVARDNLGASEIPSAALDAMEHGTLTAQQATQLQEMTYTLARGFMLDRIDDATAVPEGLNAVGVQATVNALREQGGFAGATVALGNYAQTDGGAHWVATVTTDAGRASADSWPRTDGYATAVSGDYRPPNAVSGPPAAGVFLGRDRPTAQAHDVADASVR